MSKSLREIDSRRIESLKRRYQNKNSSPASASERASAHRMRVKAQAAIAYLAALAKVLPEDQSSQIFTEETLRPLVDAIVLGSRDDSSLPRQLSLAEMFIGMGASLSRRIKEDRLGGNIESTVKEAQKVLIAARMAKLKK